MNTPSNQRLTTAATILKIRKNVLTAEKLIEKSIFQQLVNQKNDDKQKLKIKALDDDDKKKKKKNQPNILSKIGERASVRTGIFEGIANFLSYTFLGFIISKIMPLLPKAIGIIGLLKPAGQFVALVANLFLNTIGGFIETGYKIHDQIKGEHDNIKKIAVKPAFDSFLNTLNNTLSDVVKIAYGVVGQQAPEVAKKEPKKPVKGAAVGGVISPTRGNVPVNKPVTRGVQNPRQKQVPRKQTVPETTIGKDVGGEDNIRKFYRSPKVGVGGILGIFRPKGTTARKTPVDSISNISKTLRRRNQLFGDIASVGSDIALGQKPSKMIYKNTAKDVITLAQYISDRQQEKNKEAILAMAYGGVIPTSARNISNGNTLVDMVAVVIQRSVEDRVNRAIGEFRRPVGRDELLEDNRLKAEEGPSYNDLMNRYGGPGGYVGGEYGGYRPTGDMERQIYEYLTKDKKLNDVQALGLMANIQRESSFNPSIKEKGGTGVGLFQWSHGRVAPFKRAVPDWETNWKAQIDYALNEPQSLSMVRPGEYASRSFATAQEAADWWMNEWERPRDKISGSRKHSGYLKNVPRAPSGSVMFRAPSQKEGLQPDGAEVKTSLEKNNDVRAQIAGIPYINQLTSSSGKGFRECFSASSAMLASVYLGKNISLTKYNSIRSKFGDTTVSGSHIQALSELGIKASVEDNGSLEEVEKLILKGKPVVIGLNHNNASGHFIMVTGITKNGDFIVNDPFGVLNQSRNTGWAEINGNSQSESVGKGVTYKKEFLRSIFEDRGRGTGRIMRIQGEVPKQKIKQQPKIINAEDIKLDERNKKIKKPNTTELNIKNRTGSSARKTGYINSQSRQNNTKPSRKQQQPNLFQRAAQGIRKLTGFKKGGLVGDAISNYAPYESYGNNMILAVQPMIIEKEMIMDRHIPIAFPISSGVNNNTLNRA